ncbi:HAD-IIA family hydrolase [soil metagenome]
MLDLDGVVWLDDEPIDGAAGAVALLQRSGEAVVFVTNNSSVTVADQEAKLARHGIAAEGAVVTSAMAAAGLVAPGERALVCAGDGVRAALLARGAEPVTDGDADVVVVGFHRHFDYEGLRVAATAVQRGARLVATNDDATFPTPAGPIPGGGAILAAVATATGVSPTVAGKPHQPMADVVLAEVAARGTPSPGHMVGDRPDTDGLFARLLGYRFELVLSGITTAGDLPVDPEPDRVADTLADLVANLHA